MKDKNLPIDIKNKSIDELTELANSIIENLEKEKAVDVLNRVLGEESRQRATVLLYAKEHEMGVNTQSTFSDIEQWKNSRKYQ